MKAPILILFIWLFSNIHLKAQEYTIGKYDTLYSSVFKQSRRILVHVPHNGTLKNVNYPVMYILDGDAHFTKTIGILEHLSRTAGNELCPEMIVVGVFHPNRERDLIPPSITIDSNKNDKFPDFMEKELIPYIDKFYPTSPYRVLAGHSLGGLRVINTLVYQPELFQSYIALDPSLGMVKNWIGNANDQFNKQNYQGKSLYIAMGMTMPKGMDTSVIINDTSGNARHMRCIMTFARNADLNKNNGLEFNWKYYPDETHQSVMFKGTYDGLISNFSWYKNLDLYDIFKPNVTATASVKIITDYYKRISDKMGYHQIAPEQGTSELIDYLNFKKWFDKALAFAKLNSENYPNSERAKFQYQQALWNSRKSLFDLYPQKNMKWICIEAKKDFNKKEPLYNLSEETINTFGYELLNKKNINDALLVFKLNVDLYPESYNVYDSYGECLLLLGNEKEGIAAYQKSLELNPNNSNAEKILKQAGLIRK